MHKPKLIIILLAMSLGLAVILQWNGIFVAHAASYTVTKTADTNDGACDADCSLREAIIAANADEGHDTITIGPGTYQLTIAGNQENDAATGDLDINSHVTIQGAGPELTFIDAAGLGSIPDRVFDVNAWSGYQAITPMVLISGVTILNGSLTAESSCLWYGSSGGGIRGQYADITLINTHVVSNTAVCSDSRWGNGGGIGLWEARLTLDASIIRGNSASMNGGGVMVAISGADDVTVMATGSTIDLNTAGSSGGGIAAFTYGEGPSGRLEVNLADTVVSGNSATQDDGPTSGGGIYFFGAHDGPAAVALNNSTLNNNLASGQEGLGGCGTAQGGGAWVYGGDLTLAGTTVSGNTAMGQGCDTPSGGGIYHSGFFGGDYQLLVDGSTIDGNAAESGGGIYALSNSASIDDSTISNNTAAIGPNADWSGLGGGIAHWGQSDQPLALSNSTLSHNAAGRDGGGSYGDVTVLNSQVHNNGAGRDGGGLHGPVGIVDSAIYQNVAGGGGAGVAAHVSLDIVDSVIYGNTATGDGGGIWTPWASNGQPVIEVRNSTISGNSAASGGGISDSGGVSIGEGFYSKVHLLSSTVAHNTAAVGGGVHHLVGEGVDDFRVMTLENSLLAENSGGNCGGDVTDTQFTSHGHNLSDDATCILVSDGDITKVPAQISPLQDNGGETLTHALLTGSPAIDAANDTTCPPADQRGVARPKGAACDIGAFEYIATEPFLVVDPTELSFVAVVGGASPVPQVFLIDNSGAGTLNWTASESISWLSLGATAGTGPADVTVLVDQSGLGINIYTGQITVSAAGASNSPQTVDVTLQVIEPGDLLGNGGFEEGDNGDWAASSSTGRYLIQQAADFSGFTAPHSGNWAAVLGEVDGETSVLSQTIPLAGGASAPFQTISLTDGAGAPSLRYYYYAHSTETGCTFDTAVVSANGTPLAEHPLCVANNTTAWTSNSLDLSAHVGQEVTISFSLTNDAISNPSTFLLDDVSIAFGTPEYDHRVFVPLLHR